MHAADPNPPFDDAARDGATPDCECDECLGGDWAGEPFAYEDPRPWYAQWCGARHSSTHGRAIGAGEPLRGTSWLNRPYSLSLDLGGLVMIGNPAAGVDPGNDLFAALQAGWDWDHYWGGQLRVGWSTPDLQSGAPSSDDQDNLFLGDISLLHYPLGEGVGELDVRQADPEADVGTRPRVAPRVVQQADIAEEEVVLVVGR
ncbi:MAG: hypothetical protein AAF790_11060, partial [Planctomycetota bacterium]